MGESLPQPETGFNGPCTLPQWAVPRAQILDAGGMAGVNFLAVESGDSPGLGLAAFLQNVPVSLECEPVWQVTKELW